MHRLLLSAFSAFIFCCSLLLEQIVIACGGGEDPYDYYYSFFHNNTAGSPAYMPFYFVTGYEYYDDWNGPYTPLSGDDLNLKEWIAFGDNRFGYSDAAAFVYKYSHAQLSNLYYHLEQGRALQLPDSVLQNGMTRWFRQDKDLEALGYLMYAKKCEAHAAPASRWDAPSRNISSMNGAVRAGLQLWKAAKKDFFRWRYAYQVLRMAFYSQDYEGTDSLYKVLIGDKTADNIMYYRCLALRAGVAYRKGDYNRAAYQYALAFNATDDNKFSNYVSYAWCFRAHGDNGNIPGASRDAVLRLARNNSEQAVIAVMDALHEYGAGLPLMQEAYALDPAVKGLDVAMTREINKMEMNILDPALRERRGFHNAYYHYTLYDHYRKSDPKAGAVARRHRENLAELIRFCSQVATERKAADPAFWPLAVAYLYFIQQDWKNTETWIGKAEAMNPQGRCKDMLLVERLLLAINKGGRLDTATESAILPSLQWLRQRARQDARFSVTYRNLMTSVLPNVYMQQKDTIKALLCIAAGTTGPEGKGGLSYWYPEAQRNAVYVDPGSSEELEQVTTTGIIALRDWIGKTKKTPFEQFLVQHPPYRQGTLDLYIGARYLRQMDFARAVEAFRQVPRRELERYGFQDPLADRWIDTQEPSDTVIRVNRLSFAQQMLQLQSGLDKADAATLYRYANGLYSMTYYGLSWKAGLYYRSGTDGMAYYKSEARNHLLPEHRNYYTAEEAARYYQKAFDRSKDPELKAKCLYMLSKCWQKSAPLPQSDYYDPRKDTYFLYTLQSPYFRLLAKDYRETEAFRKGYEDCSYLRYYIREMNKE